MTHFKDSYMRVNNPDHSVAVQQWLFNHGYHWKHGHGQTIIDYPDMWDGDRGIILLTSQSGYIHCWDSEDEYTGEEIDVSHFDPHITTTQASDESEDSMLHPTLDGLIENFNRIQQDIDDHDHKQRERIKERDLMVDQLNSMLPDGWCLVKS